MNAQPAQEPTDPIHSKLLWLVIGGFFTVLLLTVWLPVQDALTHLLMKLGGDTFLQHTTVPYELRFVSTLLTLLGFHIQAGRAYLMWQQALGKQEYIYFTWNCGGWQSFLLFVVSLIPGLQGRYTLLSKWQTIFFGLLATYLFTLFRLLTVLLFYLWFGRPLGILFHDYLTVFLTFGYLALFWWFARRFLLTSQAPSFFVRMTGKSVMALLLCVALLSNYLVFFSHVPVAHASGNPTIEQQINIVNGSFTSGGVGDGMVLLDTGNYTGATYYFEVVAQVTSGTGTAVLTYNAGTGATASGGSTVTISNISATSYTRSRSASFSPTGAQNAYVSSLTGTGITLQAARIIIIQTNGTSINNTVTQVEVGDNETTTNTSDTTLSKPKYWKYDSSKYDGTVTVYLEATMSNNTGGDSTTVTLYPSGGSCSGSISGSAVTMTGTTTSRVRSSDISGNLTSGNTYMVCFKASAGTASINNAHIVIQQTSSNGLTKMEIYHTYVNTQATSSSTTLVGKNFYNEYEAGNWAAGTFTYYFEATFKSSNSSDTVTVQICYKTTSNCDTTVGNSVTTTSIGSTLVRSSSFSSAPPDTMELDTGMKVTTGTDTNILYFSSLVIDVSSLQTPERVFPFLPLAFFIPLFVSPPDKRRKWMKR